MSDSGNDAAVSFSSALAAGILATVAYQAPLALGILSALAAGVGGYLGSIVYRHIKSSANTPPPGSAGATRAASTSPNKSPNRRPEDDDIGYVLVCGHIGPLATAAAAGCFYSLVTAGRGIVGSIVASAIYGVLQGVLFWIPSAIVTSVLNAVCRADEENDVAWTHLAGSATSIALLSGGFWLWGSVAFKGAAPMALLVGLMSTPIWGIVLARRIGWR